MAILIGVPSGGIIELADLDVSHLFEGTTVGTIDSEDNWQLVASSATVDHVDVESVKDNATLRWVRVTDTGGGPGLNPATVYASPDGNDNNDGTTWQAAVRTGYVAYEKIVDAGGGILRIANGTVWGGPVPGQGMWLRDDGQEIEGWQPLMPFILQGEGPGSTVQFQELGTAILHAGSNLAADYRRKPAIWIAHARHQTVLTNIETRPISGMDDGQVGNYYPFRIGWDYPRNSDGTVMSQAISSSTRTGSTANGETVHTVALAPAVSIPQAQRAGNLITFYIPRPGNAAAPPWRAGTKVWFESTDPAFTSGAYEVFSTVATIDNDALWTFSVVDVGSDTALISTPGTIRSLVVQADDLIDLESNNAQFPSTSYLCIDDVIVDGTTGTITVFDPYGGYNGVSNNFGPTANIGVLIQQERGYNGGLKNKVDNCTSIRNQTDLIPKYTRIGPAFDFGGGVAFPYIMDNSLIMGLYPPAGSGMPYDKWNMSAVVQAINQVPGCGAGMYASNISAIQGSFSMRLGAGTAIFSLNKALFEATNPAGDAPPGYLIDGGSASVVYLNAVQYADTGVGFGHDLDEINGVSPQHIIGDSAYGPYTFANGGSIAPSSNGMIVGQTSPWVGLKVGTWADLKITGKHPAAWRQLAPATARFHNMAGPPASWTMLHGSKTTGISDPNGGTGACRVTDTGSAAEAEVFNGTDSINSWAAGGRFVIAGWINQENLSSYNANLIFGFVGAGDVIWQSTGTGIFTGQSPFSGKGWQYVVVYDTVVSASASQDYSVRAVGPAAGSSLASSFFGVAAFYVPPSIDDNDFYEYIGTLRAQPYYLLPGMAGTFEEQKFIAHGGLGVKSSLVVAETPGTQNRTLIIYDQNGDPLIKLSGEAP